MRFFHKLFLCTALILTVSLSVMTCITLSISMENSIQRECNAALSEHQLLEYAIACSILNVVSTGMGVVNEENIAELAERSATLLADTDHFLLVDAEGNVIAGDGRFFNKNSEEYKKSGKVEENNYHLENPEPVKNQSFEEEVNLLAKPKEDQMVYEIQNKSDKQQIFVSSSFSQNHIELCLYTTKDITYIFQDMNLLLQREKQIFLLVLTGSCGIMLLLAWYLTRPIAILKESVSAFSKGNYDSRAEITAKDEFAELAVVYNQMAEALQQKIADLELAAKQKEDFTANFAHELKTPMTSIIGYADMIYQKKMSEEEIRSAAGYIVNEGMRLEALSFKLMDLLTLEHKTFMLEETQMKEFFEDIRESIEPLARKRQVELEFRCSDGWARIEMDLFKTMILNLLDNALKSGGDKIIVLGKIVQYKRERSQKTGNSIHSEKKDERYYRIIIRDNGRGIPEKELARITEAFYMVDKARSRKEHGAGLGLALASRIAAIHDTQIKYRSVVGEGTEVMVDLKTAE